METGCSQRDSPGGSTGPGAESDSCDCVVAASEKPVFIEHLQDAEVMEGTRLYLTCSFAGRPMPQIQWLRDTTPIHSSAIYRVGIIEITETGVSLGWAEVSPVDGHLN